MIMQASADNQEGVRRKFLSAEDILRFFITSEEKTEDLIILKKGADELYTTDLALHESFGSIKPYDDFRANKLSKFFENVDVQSFRAASSAGKPVLTHERVEELRAAVLGKAKS